MVFAEGGSVDAPSRRLESLTSVLDGEKTLPQSPSAFVVVVVIDP
jgi:hypothetical protein